MMEKSNIPERIKLVEINPHLTCHLCKGYYIDATTISECLHSFCRSCIIKFLHENSYCPICEVIINKAKPNLKLDKTLQDIVYKLVPELFLNEMLRRQRFFRNRPDMATKVTPEQRGEDTERTIFNPMDSISLSIEYISDDSTPGAILIPQLIDKGVDTNNKTKNNVSDDENSAIKRFLQCPGMCRVEVLKKFIRNKYNVDTSKYYIDILYKRVPLPDHYTLIDIAYIYSWKRNEPLNFFFKITDNNLVNDNFDYLIQPQIKNELKNAKLLMNSEKEALKSEITAEICGRKVSNENDVAEKEKPKEYTNLTLDRSNNMEIITKIQKVSNKNGLQIGIKITKQTVKKSRNLNGNNFKGPIKIEQPKIKSPEVEFPKGDLSKTEKSKTDPSRTEPPKTENPQSPLEIDSEKSKFLKSIELTAKKNLIVPKKDPVQKRKNSTPIKTEKTKKSKKLTSSRPKILSNPTVRKMVSNVNQNMSNLSKIVEKATPNLEKTKDLQALLFDSYKINIPSSLSVTVTNEAEDAKPPTFQKPVQNYIEILKIPDSPTKKAQARSKESVAEKTDVPKTNTNMEDPKSGLPDNTSPKTETPPKIPETQKPENAKPENASSPKHLKKTPASLPPSPVYLPCKVTNMPTRDNFIKLNPRTSQTFQKMFEDAIKKPEFNTKFQTLSVTKTEVKKSPTPKPTLNGDTPTTGKRNILEIASKLYKKTKMEQEKITNDVHNLPKPTNKSLTVSRTNHDKKQKLYERGNPPLKDFNSYISSKPPTQTVTNLHSPSLGLNYTVSLTQANPTSKHSSPNLEVSVNSSSSPQNLSLSPDSSTTSSVTTATPTSPTTSKSENSQPTSPNKLMEKYKIQNLAQLTANFNFSQNMCMNSTANQLAAIQQAMIYRHFEMQNHQNWLNMNSGPLMQYEKYLKSLSKS